MNNKELKKLKNNINFLIKKYKNDKLNILDYFYELYMQFYNFAETTGNYDWEKILSNIVNGEDCEGIVSYPNFNSLYYFYEKNVFEEIDYKLLTKLSKLAIKEIKNSIQKEC